MTAGYSGTPLPRKLGLKPGHVVALVGAPAEWTIAGVGADIVIRRDLRKRPDVALVFVRSLRELRRRARPLVATLGADAALWLVWPRKAGGHASDVTEQALRDELLPAGLVDTKVAALDDDWSGLRFVWRRERRPATAVGRARVTGSHCSSTGFGSIP